MRAYLYPFKKLVIPDILNIGFADTSEKINFGPIVRQQYIIHYVVSGRGFFNGNPVSAGEGFLIYPDTYESYYPDGDDPWSILWVISQDSAMENFFSLHNADRDSGIFKFHNIYEMQSTAEKIAAHKTGTSSSHYLAEIFLHIINQCVEEKRSAEIPAAKIYFDFSVNYIKTHLHLSVTVDGLCKTIGITQPYLYRIFMDNLGVPPKQYISDCRLTQAKKLLSETDLSVTEIAHSIGFHDVLAFSKFFSSKTKISPTKYRQNSR
ncbi:MAG: AraC family transcriptional regulator [Ruminococcaceae bacterium]|nr:AraC family transcriptional regulator [Oscillospiraceae bacterium]